MAIRINFQGFDRDGPPLYLQIALQVKADIQEGRLRAGDILPGTRTLSEELGLARNSIRAAFDELVAEGCLQSQPGQGYRVLEPPLQPVAGASATGPSVGFDLPTRVPAEAPQVQVGIDLREALPDPQFLPQAELGRALRRSLSHCRAEDPDLEPFGFPPLREALAAFLLTHRGLRLTPEQVLVTRGEIQATDLLMRAFLRPGRTVAMEAPGLPQVREQALLAGATLVDLPVDAGGARLEGLWDGTVPGPVRMVILSPSAQVPTGAVLAPERRASLLAWAMRNRVAVVEWDGEGIWGGAPALLAEDPAGVVVHVGGTRPLLGPALRLGWIAGPRSLISRLASLRSSLGARPEPTLERALRDLLEEGTLDRLALKLRTAVLQRSAELGRMLGGLGPGVGGAFWVPTGPASADAWVRRAEAEGIRLRAGSHFHPEHLDLPFLRLPFMAHDAGTMTHILARLAELKP